MSAATTLDFLRRVEELIATGRVHQAHLLVQQAINQIQSTTNAEEAP